MTELYQLKLRKVVWGYLNQHNSFMPAIDAPVLPSHQDNTSEDSPPRALPSLLHLLFISVSFYIVFLFSPIFSFSLYSSPSSNNLIPSSPHPPLPIVPLPSFSRWFCLKRHQDEREKAVPGGAQICCAGPSDSGGEHAPYIIH